MLYSGKHWSVNSPKNVSTIKKRSNKLYWEPEWTQTPELEDSNSDEEAFKHVITISSKKGIKKYMGSNTREVAMNENKHNTEDQA